jgi:hypothetical protein
MTSSVYPAAIGAIALFANRVTPFSHFVDPSSTLSSSPFFNLSIFRLI